ELQRAEARARRWAALQVVLDFLIDRQSAGPAGRRVRAALDVAGKQFDSCQQAADAAHVIVAVAADLIANAVEDERALLERLQRLQALLEGGQLAFLVGPERGGHDAVGAEQDDQPLLAPLLIGEAEAGQVQNERQRRRSDA